MSDKPISFSAPMVRAILEGRKTMTRRVLTPSNTYFNGSPWQKWTKAQVWDWNKAWVDQGPSPAGNPGPYLHLPWKDGDDQWEGTSHRIYPKIQPRDHLWVRETWGSLEADHTAACHDPAYRKPRHGDKIVYRADPASAAQWGSGLPSQGGFMWRPSIHMPRWASRITLEVTGVKVERLQDISEEDAKAEGILPVDNGFHWVPDSPNAQWATLRYRKATDAFSGLWKSINGPDSLAENPWVAAISFKRSDIEP